MNTRNLIIAAVTVLGLFCCGSLSAQDAHAGHDHAKEDHPGEKKKKDEHAGHDHAKEGEKDEHAQEVVEKVTVRVGDAAVIVISHDITDGEATLTVFAKDQKTALAPKDAPRLNLVVDGKKKQLKSTKTEDKNGNVFSIKSEALKKKMSGQVSIKITDKRHLADIYPHVHGAGCTGH